MSVSNGCLWLETKWHVAISFSEIVALYCNWCESMHWSTVTTQRRQKSKGTSINYWLRILWIWKNSGIFLVLWCTICTAALLFLLSKGAGYCTVGWLCMDCVKVQYRGLIMTFGNVPVECIICLICLRCPVPALMN